MENSIGKRVKTLRIDRRMTLAELGEKANLSTSYLSQIERDRTNPSLTTLMNIARSLNVEPRHFFESGDDTTLVLRDGSGRQPEMLSPAIAYFALSREGTDIKLQVHRVVIQPGSLLQDFDPYSGEEMCFVLSGQLTVVVGDETHILETGDSIHYDALLLHNWCNQGDKPCELIWSRASY